MVHSTLLDAAPGIDAFFTSSWDIINDDIVYAMNELLVLAVLPTFLTHTAIVLILKKRVTEAPGVFCPISLCQAYLQSTCSSPPQAWVPLSGCIHSGTLYI